MRAPFTFARGGATARGHAKHLAFRAGAIGLIIAPALRATPIPLLARPTGWSMPGGYRGGGPTGGLLLGVDGSWAATLAADGEPSRHGWSVGARAGWAFPKGLDAHVRFDSLGIRPAWSKAPLQLATAGLRYSAPFIVPLPFAEVNAGAAFLGRDARFGASGGIGVELPFGHHVLVDLFARDWLIPAESTWRQTLTAGVGLTITLASPGH